MSAARIATPDDFFWVGTIAFCALAGWWRSFGRRC